MAGRPPNNPNIMDGRQPTPFQNRVLAEIPEDINMLLAGGRGGGKSEVAKFLMIKHAVKYGANAKILYVRETWGALGQFEDELALLILSLYGKKVKHNQTEHTFTWPSGAVIYMNQLADEKDYVKFQGKSFTLIVIDEYGAMSNTKYCWLLMSNMRAPVGVPLRVILLANPGGFQHGHIHKDFISQAVGWKPFKRKDEWWVHCPSTWRDNPTIDREDYLRRLRESCNGDEELFKAWDTGDWNIARGAYFAGTLDEKTHMLSGVAFEPGKPRIISAECPYIITPEWCPYIAHDWGSSVPSWTGLFVESPGVPGFMKGSFIIVDELATYDPSDTQYNTGLEWPPSKLADSMVNDLCKPWGVDPMGVGDDSKGIEDSLLKKFREYGVYLTKPHKERISGWQEMNNLFLGAKTGERPGLWVSDRCVYWWLTVPFLQRDPKRFEDIVTKGPDHAGDGSRYGVLYRTRGAKSGSIEGDC